MLHMSITNIDKCQIKCFWLLEDDPASSTWWMVHWIDKVNQTCSVYLNDIIVYGKTPEEHNKKTTSTITAVEKDKPETADW